MSNLMQQAPQSFRGRMFRQDISRPKEKRILVLKTGIAGMQFHIENEEEQATLDALQPGYELLLFREPDNQYDEWAVAVYLTKQDKIGFISRFKNETIARLMDAGKKFIAIVDAPEEEAEDSSQNEDTNATAKKRSRYSATENMKLPFSVYLIEEA